MDKKVMDDLLGMVGELRLCLQEACRRPLPHPNKVFEENGRSSNVGRIGGGRHGVVAVACLYLK